MGQQGLNAIWKNVLSFFLSIWTYRLVRWGIAAVFFYAGWSKLWATTDFAVIIHAYGLLPLAWVEWAARVLPVVEMVFACALISDIRGSLCMITLLLLLFMGVLLYGMHMGFDLNCGCFKSDGPVTGARGALRLAFARDVLMLLAIGYLYVWRWLSRSRTREQRCAEPGVAA